MESAFEGDDARWFVQPPVSLSESKINRAVQFSLHYPDDKERLISIMENIITNKGEFKPETETFPE
jgi:hypothetical protein